MRSQYSADFLAERPLLFLLRVFNLKQKTWKLPQACQQTCSPPRQIYLLLPFFFMCVWIKLHNDWDIHQNYSLHPDQCITPNTNSFLSDSSSLIQSRYQDTIVHILNPTLDQHKLMLQSVLTFAWPLYEQEPFFPVISRPLHHTGKSSLHPGGLLRRLSGEVLNTQLIIPGLRGTQGTCYTVRFTYRKILLISGLYRHLRGLKGRRLTAVFYVRQLWSLCTQLPQKLLRVLLLFDKNLCRHTTCLMPLTGENLF